MTLLIKTIILVLLLMVVFNLFHALWLMLKGNRQQSMTQSLGRRLMFSALIVFALLLLLFFGGIQPNPRPY